MVDLKKWFSQTMDMIVIFNYDELACTLKNIGEVLAGIWTDGDQKIVFLNNVRPLK